MLRPPRPRGPGPAGLCVRRHRARAAPSRAVPAVWPAVHPGHPARGLHGLDRGGVCCPLDPRPFPRPSRLWSPRMSAALPPARRAPLGPPLDLVHGVVERGHGGGGRTMVHLVETLFRAAFTNPALDAGNDHAVLARPAGRVVVSTDAHVVSPLFFPGGDIGSLSVHGTLNDVAMAGAVPIALSAAFILEEGFPLADLARIVASMAEAAREAGVPIVTGDTKVVERGHGDGVFITTTGVGVVAEDLDIRGDRAQPGDVVVVSGPIGAHGVAILSQREGLSFETPVVSDSQSLHDLVAALVAAVPDIHVLRDPTRGGVAATLNEIADQSGAGMVLEQEAIPVAPGVAGVCELLGLDPLTLACEGRLLALCAEADAPALMAALTAHPKGREARIIGRVVADPHRFVRLITPFGGQRLVDWLSGDQLPRIC
uniref:Hydrogenase expression/formation protein HypE n=1 Tax=Pararhodospirillum photometricum DSM 122 TaxID=1150469 RepID=H6SN14_PARPM